MMKKSLILILAILVQTLSAQPRQYLHDGWTFGQARKANRYEAKVPGVVHTDLLRHHLIDDPYIGLNERKVQWVDKEDWIYETTFRVSSDIIGNDHIELCFDGLDTYADVYLNEKKIIEADNMFRRWRTAIEAHRRNMPHCMGSLLWQHDDCWPVASWATRDYYGRWKAAHYMVRHAFEPLLCSAITRGDTMQVYAVSDLLKQQRGTLKLTSYSLDGKLLATITNSVTIPANTSTRLLKLPVQQLLNGQQRENVVISMQLTTASGAAYQANTFLCLPKDLRLQPVTPEISVEKDGNGCVVTLKSDKFVRALCLSVSGDDCRLSDNYIDLLPGIPSQVHITTRLTADELKRKLETNSLNDIP